ncbi:Tumor susceptibility gene 101 protein [Eumeta japonica]|uniref:Tumor susceptibility gene 101 protein n=1 Tax=Eumeta variegata TaxID=151549 RepID=A0A4C1ULE0_EUMVA|nr:Tumor susceptibility gene 101 protein [Eumeta japonica]
MANDEAILKQYLVKYKHPEYVAREVINVIQRYRTLTYRREVFVFNNGSRKDLLQLDGTIPVNYKGAVYNIPVCVWLMDTHPQNAPLCFVKPTSDMCIKVSKYVDSNGKIYLPYLHEWNSNSTILNLIKYMITAFGELPPVYSKPRTEASLPYPVNTFMPQPSGYPYPQIVNQTPYPTAAPGYPTTSNMPYPNIVSPYPGYPGSVNGTPYPNPPTSTPYPPTSTPYPPTSTPYPTTGAYSAGSADIAGGTITEEHIKASLLSAVEDKLRRRLKEQSQQSMAELETLRRTQQELGEGKARLEDIVSKLQKEHADLDTNIAILQEKEKELEAAIERIAEHEGVDVDEAVVTIAPLYSQLLNAFAEEATLEDAIYYMGEALRKEVIDLDTFLKQVRTLARRQFTLRALMHKCRQKAHLAC